MALSYRNILSANFLCIFLLNFLHFAGGFKSDPKGYILYCPCMGRFGNQADQFLGALAFARAIDRTLVLPPWVEYKPGQSRSVQVPFDMYFRVDSLQEYHRVMTMEDFMKDLAPTVWPSGQRVSFCYGARPGGNKANDCNAKDGNPFGPFWDTFGIEFDQSEFYTPLFYDTTNAHEVQRWKERYPAKTWPVLAFTGAPGAFPVTEFNAKLQRFIKFSDNLENKANSFIKENIGELPFIGIHMRNGVDFKNACEHVGDGSPIFASAQCTGYRGEYGKITKEVCYPNDETVVKQLKSEVKRLKIDVVFIATDDRDLIPQFSKAMKKIRFVRQPTPASPHLDIAILTKADHFIGNCVSTFTSFIKRSRDVEGRTSSFWAFPPSTKQKREEL